MRQPLDNRESKVDVMHVTLRRGGAGRDLEVELFSFQFELLCGATHYLIGIREFNNEVAADPGPLAGAALHHPRQPAPESGDLNIVSVTVDACDFNMPVLGLSEGFQR